MKALILDDHADDARLLALELQRSGLEVEWRQASSREEYEKLLDWPPDVVLADYTLPAFSAPEALEVLTRRGLDIPFIVVSGSIGEEVAVTMLKQGAADYLLKDRLIRAASAIRRALDDQQQRRATRDAERRLRESEERMRFALEASRVGVWEANLQTGEARWSEILESLHGLAPGTFAGTFEGFIERIDPADRDDVQSALNDATRRHTDSSILYRSTWPDGSVHWIRGRGRTFYDSAGRPMRAAGVGYDVTELRALDAQYQQAQKMEAVGQLAGGIAHDFNNLLTVIKGFSQIVLEESVSHGHDSELRQILYAAERASALTRQLLAFGRRQILEVSVFDLREAVDRMVPMLKRVIGEQIEIVVNVVDTGCAVRADAAQIDHVMLNLAINARDAMPGGGKLVFDIRQISLDDDYVRRRPYAATGPHVVLGVSDTGIGMDAATADRVFEPFFTTKTKDKGTGLGLSTVYGIVKQSGGHVTVYSEPGIGTTFRVYLPAVLDSAVENTPPPSDPVDARGGSETILAVEDDEGVRALIAEVLVKRGYQVLLAANPDEAIRLITEQSPAIDLLLTDVVLPGINGKALADRLKSERPALRVLYMSGYTDAAIVQHGVLEPGTPFLPKPFSPQSLAQKVRDVLNG